jgi:hypothetical protein
MCLFDSGFGGNGATMFFLVFALLASVLGIVSKFIGGNHIRAWRSDSLASAGATSIIAWAVTALAMGYTNKNSPHSLFYITLTQTPDTSLPSQNGLGKISKLYAYVQACSLRESIDFSS